VSIVFLELSELQEAILREIANALLTPKVIAIRAQIILLTSERIPTSIIAEELNVSTTPIYKWPERWIKAKSTLDNIEKEKSRSDLKNSILTILKDAKRSGAPPKFTEKQVIQIIALACTPPENVGLPVSQWSCKLLAEHSKTLGIVDSISNKQINNFLKSGRVKTS
jgi:putative transposase